MNEWKPIRVFPQVKAMQAKWWELLLVKMFGMKIYFAAADNSAVHVGYSFRGVVYICYEVPAAYYAPNLHPAGREAPEPGDGSSGS